MANANGPEIVKRFERLKRERANHEDRWERMAPFIAPSRRGINTQPSQGEKQTSGVYDSTSMMAAELMAHFIAGYVINPSQQWMGYNLHDDRVGKIDAVKEFLEECRDRTLKRAGASLFYAESTEKLIDWGGFGTGCMIIEEAPQPFNRTINGFRGFRFEAVKTGRFLIADGPDGIVDTLMREFSVSARIAHGLWSQSPDSLPEKIINAVKSGKPDDPFKFIHTIVPRAKTDRSYGAKGMPWSSCWIELESKHVCHEGGYPVFPAAVPRYHRTPEEVFGRGRGDLAFPDTWTLNSAKRMGLEDWALKIRPPVLQAHDSVMGTLRLVPAGPTSVNTHGRDIRQVIMPFATGSHPEVSQIKEEELRKSIRQIFYVDQILQLLEVNKSEMTAFEFAKKIELVFRLIGPVYGRLEWEDLYRTVDVMFETLLQAGEFSPPPPEIFQSDGRIDIEFQNPIAKAQRAGDAESVMLAINDVAPLVQSFPQMLDLIDSDKMMAGIMDIRGVPAIWTRSVDEIAALREERHRHDAQQLQTEQVGQIAEAAGKAAPMVKALKPNGGA